LRFFFVVFFVLISFFMPFDFAAQFFARRAWRGEPVFPYAAAQRAAALVGQKDESQILVGDEGLEPPTFPV
jgi:hypothetical protein